jgi:hypothetical protein
LFFGFPNGIREKEKREKEKGESCRRWVIPNLI